MQDIAWRSLAKLGERSKPEPEPEPEPDSEPDSESEPEPEAWRSLACCALLCCAGQWCFPARQSSIFYFSSAPMQLIRSYLVVLL